MFYSYFMNRIGSLVASSAAVFLYAGAAHSQTCADAYKDGQEKEKAGHLVEAREQYSECAKSACGPFLLNECTTRHARLDSDIPSVVPVATHKSGKPYQHVQVTLDGEPFCSSLDGRALQVDPGMHEFVFTTDKGLTATEKVLILQGDRNRRIGVSLGKHRETADVGDPALPAEGAQDKTAGEAAPEADHHPSNAPAEPPAEAAPKKGVPALSWVLGGVGVLGGGGYVLLSTWGKKDNEALRQCAPSCAQSSVDRVKQRYLAADISLGVGVAALGSALVVYALRGPREESVPAQQAYAVDVHPTTAGAVASFSGSF
jgi:hypothetical protein